MLVSKNKINATGFVIYQHLHLGGHKKRTFGKPFL